ncbi:ABC transporter G family member 35-like protein, partial [Tanacetum coccineum]
MLVDLLSPKIEKKTSIGGSDGLRASISRSEDKFFSDAVIEFSDSGPSQGGSVKKSLDKDLFYSFNDGENGGTNEVLNAPIVVSKVDVSLEVSEKPVTDLKELARREKEAGIYPEAEVDCFMKATAIEKDRSSLITYYTLRILGLDVCRDTFVGDQTRRGISGGQKKRATTGEMLVGPAKTLFIDEISIGLDSSTTFQIVKCMQQIAHLNESTIFMSLLQQSLDQQPSTLEDPVISECCGSNVTQEEQGHMAEGDLDGKVEVGYDSLFEDGELREPIGWEDSQVEEKETVDCASDNIN